MANGRSSPLNPNSWRLVVLVGVPVWASAGAVRTLGFHSQLTTALLAEQLAIAAVAILLYLLANSIGWPRTKRASAVLQQLVLLGAFALCVPPILLASQSAPEFRLAATLDYLVTYLLGLGVILGVRSRLELRDADLARAALQEAATRAHLYALRMQMNPHFAFNTLNSIAALLDRDPRRAKALLFAMSGLFQRTLSASRHEWHTVAEELAIARDYIQIQGERAAQSIECEILVDPETEQTRLPSLLLQPLIENAVLHGVTGGRDRLRLWVHIWRAGRSAETLQLGVEVGNSANAPIPIHLDRDRLGLGNTRQRLWSVFGDRARLRCASPDVGTFVVNLEMPVTT